MFNLIFLLFAYASSCKLSWWPSRKCTWFFMSSAVQIFLYSVLCWCTLPLQCFQYFIDLFGTFLISYCCIRLYQCLHDTDCFILIILHLLLLTSNLSSTWKIFIKQYQHCSACFGECWSLPCLLSLQFSICCLIFVATLLLVSLTAVFIILNISPVIPATCCNYPIHQKLLNWLHFDLQHHYYHLHMSRKLLFNDATSLCYENVQK